MNQIKNSLLTPEQTYQWTDIVLNSLRESAREKGFKEITPAMLSSAYEPGAKHSVAVLGDQQLPQLSEHNNQVIASGKSAYYLPVSHVVEKQMSLTYLDKVYCLAPCLRLLIDDEDLSGKHLYNFFQFEIEWRTQSMQEVFSEGEKIIVNAANSILEQLKSANLPELKNQARNLASLMHGNYPVISFQEALERVCKPNHKGDLTQEDDYILSNQFDRPFWIANYPEGVRDSIYHKNQSEIYETYDLMLPFGYGELTTGGIRPKSETEIIEQSQQLGKQYSHEYANWKKQTGIQSAGFGIGLERLLRFITGAESILDFIQYHDNGPNKTIQKSFFDHKNSNSQLQKIA